jgi:hypothetical protein
MLGTFLYLTACSARNRIRVRIRRLKEPRYLIGSIVGAAYLYYFVIFRAVRSGRSRSGGGAATGTGPGPLASILTRFAGQIQFVGSAVLLLFAAVAWVFPGSRKPIEFSRAEVQFLFQAPLGRRQLLHYKLLRSQLGVIFSSVVATVLFRPATLTSGWTMLVGVWLLLTLFRLYSIGVSLSRESLARHGTSGLARQWAPVVVVLAIAGVLAATVALDWRELSALTGGRAVFEEVQRIMSIGAAGLVLLPFRMMARLPLASSALEFLTVLPMMLALIALSYLWVLRADTAFEEASADHAEQRAQTRTASRAPTVKTMATPFALQLEGRLETAILWKNLIMIGRYASVKVLARLAPAVIAVAVMAGQAGKGGLATLAAMLCLVLSGFTILLGPQIARNDLRQDLANLAVLKTWPARGAVIVRGEILAPAVLLTGLAWLFILASGLLFGSAPMHGSAVVSIMLDRVSYTLGAMIVAPAMLLAQLVVHNAAAVLFPAWVAVTSSRARGIDAMGQRLLMMAGLLLVLVAFLLPAVLVAGAVTAAAFMSTGMVVVILPALVITAVVFGECFLATEWLGRVLDRTDVSAIGPAE